jgi:hypothetical protein
MIRDAIWHNPAIKSLAERPQIERDVRYHTDQSPHCIAEYVIRGLSPVRMQIT